MSLRAFLLTTVSLVLTFTPAQDIFAQDINNLTTGVVRIQNNKLSEVGSGFIVKVDGNHVYIVTASHVVQGDHNPDIYLFTQQRDALKAEVLDMEAADTKGLALLRLKVSSTKGLTALELSPTSQKIVGEDIKVIGFPDSTSYWTVVTGSIARIEGRNLVFSGAIRGGNSGGPVILNGLVIGMVTDVSQSSAYAARAEVIETYVNGIEPNLITFSKPRDTRPSNSAASNEFCQVLNTLVASSENGFYTIVGDATDSEDTFYTKTILPGAKYGYVNPKERVYYSLLNGIRNKGAVQSEFYATVTKVKACFPDWQEKENTDSSYHYHKFRKVNETTIVRVYYNVTAQGNNHFFLILSIDIPRPGHSIW